MVAATFVRGSRATPNASSIAFDAGPVKPIASSTRSAAISNSLPGISVILVCPSAPRVHSRRAPTSFSTRPFRPSKRFVATDQSRLQPSSCDEDVRSFVGQ